MSINNNPYVLIILLVIIIYIMYQNRMPGVCIFDNVLNKLRKDSIKIEPRSVKLEFFPSDESYTEDKTKIFLCLKDINGNYYEYNHLIQVLIHELAHAFTTVIDKEHKTPEFNNLHNFYREKASELNLVNLNDRVPPNYCKM